MEEIKEYKFKSVSVCLFGKPIGDFSGNTTTSVGWTLTNKQKRQLKSAGRLISRIGKGRLVVDRLPRKLKKKLKNSI